ncbi:MAG: polyprenyl diphosphate synthase [Candidatus Lightella neohaematopini]|nr:polyprenyl diphosphate synthase [Candidatus Lightella neohaematopini]MCV2531057.1 polyprenyl diphosphate synthase [Candidatus Lightella neohaematopini]
MLLSNINIPKHIAIIMDGNRRWAKIKGKLSIFGHQEGVRSAGRAIEFAIKNNLNTLTLYAFSSENWNRSISEVKSLMELFQYSLKNGIYNLHNKKVRLKIIGDTSKFEKSLKRLIFNSEELTKNNHGLNLNIAINYGGRWDIIQGIKKIINKVQKGLINPNQINEQTLCQVISMNDLDPVDLVIRTGGEYRISNFLLWQIAYSELFFTDVLWPDFNDNVFFNAIKFFSQRNRRFGTNK